MAGSFFFGAMIMGLAKFEVDGDIPVPSKSVSSCHSHVYSCRGSVHGFWSKGFMLSLGWCVICTRSVSLYQSCVSKRCLCK